MDEKPEESAGDSAPAESPATPVVVQTTWAKAFERVALRAITISPILLLLLLPVWFFNRVSSVPRETIEAGGEIVDAFGESTAKIAEAFHRGTVTTQFRAHNTEVNAMSRLQVAEVEELERFSKESTSVTAWGAIPLPAIAKEIEVPTTFTYYLDFNETWKIDWDETTNVVSVQAPVIRFNKPAPDLSNLRYTKDDTSYFRFGEDDVKSELMASITPMLEKRGEDKIRLIREIARNEVAKFVQNWLELTWLGDTVRTSRMNIVFADEVVEETHDAPAPVTLNTNRIPAS